MNLENMSEQTLLEDAQQLLSDNVLNVADIALFDDLIFYEIVIQDAPDEFKIRVDIHFNNDDFELEEVFREFCKKELREYINEQLAIGENGLPMQISGRECELLHGFTPEQIAEIYYTVQRNVELFNQIENI